VGLKLPELDRIAGCVLGAAIGDALGHPVEFIGCLDEIRRAHGPGGVTGYVLWWNDGEHRFAPYTDDTQMAEVTLRSLLMSRQAAEGLDPAMERIGRGFAGWVESPQGGHRAPGQACLRGANELRNGRPWRSGDPSAGGCGSVMRAYPFGLLFDEEQTAETWAVEHSRLTHGHPMALAACAGLALGVLRALRGAAPHKIVRDIVEAAARWDGETAELCRSAASGELSTMRPENALQHLQGWNAREAIAGAVYVFARHPDRPRDALLEAVNSPGDSDSLGTLVGALVGARCGLDAFPVEWVRDVERSEELLQLSRKIHSTRPSDA
jgi:ADP-ribosylglycohydrolase